MSKINTLTEAFTIVADEFLQGIKALIEGHDATPQPMRTSAASHASQYQ